MFKVFSNKMFRKENRRANNSDKSLHYRDMTAHVRPAAPAQVQVKEAKFTNYVYLIPLRTITRTSGCFETFIFLVGETTP